MTHRTIRAFIRRKSIIERALLFAGILFTSQTMSPVRAEEMDLEQGEAIYNHTCSVCHGEAGDAKSWAQNSLYPPPRNFKSEKARELTRLAMMTTLKKGNADTAMVAFDTQLSESEMENVISYIRVTFMEKDDSIWMSLGIPEIEAPFLQGLHGDYTAGKTFFNDNCAECHGKSGKGDGRRAYFIRPKPADFTSEKMRARLNRPALFTAVSNGVAQKEMPAWSKVLKDQQIANVAEFVFSTFILPDDDLIDGDKGSAKN